MNDTFNPILMPIIRNIEDMEFSSHFNGIWGQKSVETTYDKVSIRRILLYIEKKINSVLEEYKGTFNDFETRSEILNRVTCFMYSLKNCKGVCDFEVICDTTNNPIYIIENGELKLDVIFKTEPIAEFIHINTVLKKSTSINTELIKIKTNRNGANKE